VERVEQAVLRLLDRANAVEGDLGKLVADARGSISALAETVRAGADKLRADLDVPREERGEAQDEAPARPAPAPAKPAPAPASGPAKPAAPATVTPPAKPAASPLATPADPVQAAESGMQWGAAQPKPQGEAPRQLVGSLTVPAPANGAVRSPGVGPRLEAFNMAKSGAAREEVARHLKEKFGLDDPHEILDDAFLRSGR
jgi:2-oxoglutarate dehydrogenase E2 component (dihydrolipoamide succinyltransferase)